MAQFITINIHNTSNTPTGCFKYNNLICLCYLNCILFYFLFANIRVYIDS